MNEEEKAQCAKCGVTILKTTATSHDGYCAPCFNLINGVVKPAYVPPPRKPVADFFGALIPIGLVLLFILGIPFGYKLVLGGKRSAAFTGPIQDIQLINPIEGYELKGKQARVEPDYVVVTIGPGRKLWIPEENIRGVQFKEED